MNLIAVLKNSDCVQNMSERQYLFSKVTRAHTSCIFVHIAIEFSTRGI